MQEMLSEVTGLIKDTNFSKDLSCAIFVSYEFDDIWLLFNNFGYFKCPLDMPEFGNRKHS